MRRPVATGRGRIQHKASINQQSSPWDLSRSPGSRNPNVLWFRRLVAGTNWVFAAHMPKHDPQLKPAKPRRKPHREAVDKWRLKWELALKRLRSFVDREGHALVPTKHIEAGHKLGAWMNAQRTALRLGTITPERLADIDAVDVSWRKGKKAPWEHTSAATRGEASGPPPTVAPSPDDEDPFAEPPAPAKVIQASVQEDDPFAESSAGPRPVKKMCEDEDPFA